MQRTLREYRKGHFQKDYEANSKTSQSFLSHREKSVTIDGIDLTMDEGNLTHREKRVKMSPGGGTKFYTQSNKFYDAKRHSQAVQAPKYLSKDDQAQINKLVEQGVSLKEVNSNKTFNEFKNNPLRTSTIQASQSNYQDSFRAQTNRSSDYNTARGVNNHCSNTTPVQKFQPIQISDPTMKKLNLYKVLPNQRCNTYARR